MYEKKDRVFVAIILLEHGRPAPCRRLPAVGRLRVLEEKV